MSWMQKLYQTYEFAQNQGLDDEEELALPFHIPKAVHLKVVLNEKAELVRAERFDVKKQVPIQVTEKSSKRAGSTIASYALHDNLQYIAKTAYQYLTIEYLSKVAEKDSGKKWKAFLSGSNKEKQNFSDTEKEKYQRCFEFYEKQLSDWVDSSNLEELKIVLKYIQRGSLIEDLLERKIFSFENNILFLGKEDPFSLTLVWAVELPNDPHADLWSKSNIKKQWIKYQESKSEQGDSDKDLCCITGAKAYPAEAYPKIDGNAKLVSANDTDGFTFRGRFLTDKQAVSLGREVSQKAFNMLKWLIKRQGVQNGDQVTVAWAISGKEVPSPILDTFKEFDWDNLDTSAVDNESEMEMPSENQNNVDWSVNIGQQAAAIIKKKMYGYKVKLEKSEQISLLMLDKSTDGRMALTYYQEFLPSDYFPNLDAWLDDFSWYQLYKPKDDKDWLFVAPSMERIADTILSKFDLEDKKKKAKKQLYARLLPVIAGGKNVPIPFDLVQQSFQAACNPNGYEQWEWQRNIGVACALYKGWRARHSDSSQRRTYDMSLDTQNRSRDYLYGRLLAQAEILEWYALYLQNGKKKPKRATNAERYFQQFSQRPYSTWLNLEGEKLVPYKNYLLGLGKDFYKQAIGEIMELFQHNDFTCDNRLSGEFLLGYHCQKMELTRQITERKAAKQQKTETN